MNARSWAPSIDLRGREEDLTDGGGNSSEVTPRPLTFVTVVEGHCHVAAHQMHHNEATLHLLAQLSLAEPLQKAASLVAEHAEGVIGVDGIAQIRPAVGAQVLGASNRTHRCVDVLEVEGRGEVNYSCAYGNRKGEACGRFILTGKTDFSAGVNDLPLEWQKHKWNFLR